MTGPAEHETERVRAVYARRAERRLDSRYDSSRPANRFIYRTRERDLLRLLDDAGLRPLADRSILDAGCGDGGVLRDFVRFGASPGRLAGVDLLPERIDRARGLTVEAHFEVADARALPFRDASMDLILAFTLFSSVLDDAVRRAIAAEMARVCAAGGAVLIYDFWTNPFNRDARPVRRSELRSLFPGWKASFRPATLAPPLVRALAPLPGGTVACTLLEVLPFLRTHFLAALRPGPQANS